MWVNLNECRLCMKNQMLPIKKNWIGGLDLSDIRNYYKVIATKKYSVVTGIYKQANGI